MIEATFVNPDLDDNERWEHGILLRGNAANEFHMIYIRGNGSWTQHYRLGAGEPDATLHQEVFSGIDKTPGGKNRLRLVAIGNQGWLFINNQPQGQLDLSAVAFDRANLTLNMEFAEAVTRFENFTVWKWHPSLAALPMETTPAANVGTPGADLPYVPVYGPASGAIIHEIQRPSNFFELFGGPEVEEDIMVEATFRNPYSTREGSWNYGILIEHGERNAYNWIYLSPGRWIHEWRPGEDDFTQTVWDRRSTNIDVTTGGKNQLRLVVIEGSVTIFINGEYAGNTTFHRLPDAFQVSIVVNDQQEGTTRFEGFTVWKWHPSLQELPE